MAYNMPMGYQPPSANVQPFIGEQNIKPAMPPVMMPSEGNIEQPVDEDKPELTDDEYYMEKLRKENLLRTVSNMKEKQIFLFEIFIDSIEITKENELLMTPNQMGPLPPLRVRIKFGNIPCFDIYEEEMLVSAVAEQNALSGKVVSLRNDAPSTLRPNTEHGQWKSTYGKSCLFFMIPMELIRSVQSSPVIVNVYRTVDNNYEHPASSVGHTRIRLEEDFVDCILHTGDEKTEFPVSGYQSQEYTIHNLSGEETGTVDIFMRLSCFGGMISTQYQSLKDGQEYVFKHSPGKPQYNNGIPRDLPDDYMPPKLLGKTDLSILQPMVFTEEHLLGICNVSKKIEPEDMTVPKSVLWKEYEAKKYTKDNSKCICLNRSSSDKRDNSDEIDQDCRTSYGKRFRNYDESKLYANELCNVSKTSLKPNCPIQSNCPFSTAKEKDLQDNINIKKCYCSDKYVEEKVKQFYSYEPNPIKQTEKEIKPEKLPVKVSNSCDSTKGSVKKLHLIGGGDSEPKSQLSKHQSIVDSQVTDKKETEAIKPTEEIIKSIGSVDPSNVAVEKNQVYLTNKTNPPTQWKRTLKKRELSLPSHKLSKKMLSTSYDYTSGIYPGIVIGHKCCVDNPPKVPETMGWLWDIEDKCLGVGVRKGWRPGAINKSVSKRIRFSKKYELALALENQSPKSAKKKQRGGYPSSKQEDKTSSNSDVEQPPTFHLQYTGGKYYLAMNPIKEDDELDEAQKPIQIQVMPEKHDDSLSGSGATSDTSIEVMFTCPGALRKKIIKPPVQDVDTQYVEIPEVKPSLEKLKRRSKKFNKGKITAPKTPETVVNENLWEEQQTQMSLQKKKDKK